MHAFYLANYNPTQLSNTCGGPNYAYGGPPTFIQGTPGIMFAGTPNQYLSLPNNALPAGNTAYFYFIVANYAVRSCCQGLIGAGCWGNQDQVFAIRADNNGLMHVSLSNPVYCPEPPAN